ncbi:hypothetical protein T492DRAFT_150828 [Pavlovales sp. CCMP2436]|nr:hypothetical protein T492DRAFT_150828 [Pavlovales sp. CCMP2436]
MCPRRLQDAQDASAFAFGSLNSLCLRSRNRVMTAFTAPGTVQCLAKDLARVRVCCKKRDMPLFSFQDFHTARIFEKGPKVGDVFGTSRRQLALTPRRSVFKIHSSSGNLDHIPFISPTAAGSRSVSFMPTSSAKKCSVSAGRGRHRWPFETFRNEVRGANLKIENRIASSRCTLSGAEVARGDFWMLSFAALSMWAFS